MNRYTVCFQNQNGSRPDQNKPEEMIVEAESAKEAVKIVDAKLCNPSKIGWNNHPYILRVYIQHLHSREDCEF